MITESATPWVGPRGVRTTKREAILCGCSTIMLVLLRAQPMYSFAPVDESKGHVIIVDSSGSHNG